MRFRRSEEKSGNKIEGKPTCCFYAGFETMNKFDLDCKKIDLFVRIYKILNLNVCTFPAYWNHDALGKIPYYCDIFQKELVFIFIKLFWPRKKISTGTILWFSNLVHWHVWMKVRLAFILINMLLDKSKWKKMQSIRRGIKKHQMQQMRRERIFPSIKQFGVDSFSNQTG